MRTMIPGVTLEEALLVRMISVHHRMLVSLEQVAAFEEWAPFELLAMRVFARSGGHPIGAIDIANTLGCSFAHASRLSKKLQARGLVGEFRWHQYRALSMTLEGEEWTRRELPSLQHFATAPFEDLTPEERERLFVLLGQISRSKALRAPKPGNLTAE